MKSAAFNQMMADTLTTPISVITDCARRLKEAGLLSTAPRGAPAPDMTALDAARLVIALLATGRPSECVERVRRFGQIIYSPAYRTAYAWREVIPDDEFRQLFKAETLEEVLAELFDLPALIGIDKACEWYNLHAFSLTINDFSVRAELVLWRTHDSKITGERIIPFKGAVMVKDEDGKFRHVKEFARIKGGIRTERSIAPATLSAISLKLWSDTLHQSEGKSA